MSVKASNGKVKTKVSMGMKVTRAADGSVEDYGEQYSKIVEIDYEQAVEMFGVEQADALFKGVNDGN